MVKLYGRIFINATITALTGLHIGGSAAGMEIGGLDNAVIRNPLTDQPYIPGSSLRGKMRSQLEKYLGLNQNNPIGQQVKIHTCKSQEEYSKCKVCQIFGVPGEVDATGPTRLIVRDTTLDPKSVEELGNLGDFPYTELKWEVAIDRVTSAATPRNIERVPAGAKFGPLEMVFSIYDPQDKALLKTLLNGMQMVEDDYLGGGGSRGSGKVRFENIEIYGRRSGDTYSDKLTFREAPFGSVQEVAAAETALEAWVDQSFMAR